jgi:hypothetical protein
MGDFLARLVLKSDHFAISCSSGPQVDGQFDRGIWTGRVVRFCDRIYGLGAVVLTIFPTGTSLVVLCG